MKYALDSVSTSIENTSEPLYIYGDFNFRLNFSAVVKVGRKARKAWLVIAEYSQGGWTPGVCVVDEGGGVLSMQPFEC